MARIDHDGLVFARRVKARGEVRLGIEVQAVAKWPDDVGERRLPTGSNFQDRIVAEFPEQTHAVGEQALQGKGVGRTVAGGQFRAAGAQGGHFDPVLSELGNREYLDQRQKVEVPVPTVALGVEAAGRKPSRPFPAVLVVAQGTANPRAQPGQRQFQEARSVREGVCSCT